MKSELPLAIMTVVLAPVLWLQGRQVRRMALQLPEAAGPREGVAGEGESFRLLVLGDSAAAGVGIGAQDHALTGCLVRALALQHRVHWRLVATSGHRLFDVIQAARHVPAQATDLIVVSAGINDVLKGTAPARWAGLLREMAGVLGERFEPRQVAFSGIPRIEDFPLLPQPLAGYLGLRARRLNRATHEALRTLPPAWSLVDLDLPLTPDYLARDGFHPNESASVLWSGRVLELLKRRGAS